MKPLAAIVLVLALLAAACSEESASTDFLETTTTAAALDDAAAIEAGATLFTGSCSACHGPNAEGVEGLGKALAGSDFIQGQTTGDLVAFLNVGRASDDPENTTGIAMLPKGGNPSLTDGDLSNIVLFLKSLPPPA